jgi:hypothetical protein
VLTGTLDGDASQAQSPAWSGTPESPSHRSHRWDLAATVRLQSHVRKNKSSAQMYSVAGRCKQFSDNASPVCETVKRSVTTRKATSDG